MGILFAFLAVLAWGVGDFLIQRSARKFGDWTALFYVTAFAAIALLPFVFFNLPKLLSNPAGLLILIVASFVILVAGLLDFQALKIGKLSVVEPIYAFEVPIAALLAGFFVSEWLSFWEILLIVTLMLGIFLISVKTWKTFKNIHLEKGVILAILATIGMGGVNVLFGVGSRSTDPLMINWFTSMFMAIVTGCYLTYNNHWHKVKSDWLENKKLIFSVGIFDAVAWVAYSFTTLYLPIGIATGITESYIGLASLLGVIFNKEKLKRHQWAGFFITITSAIILAILVNQ